LLPPAFALIVSSFLHIRPLENAYFAPWDQHFGVPSLESSEPLYAARFVGCVTSLFDRYVAQSRQ